MEHRDPCDRHILASAAALDLPLVTLDPKISSFAPTVGVRIVWLFRAPAWKVYSWPPWQQRILDVSGAMCWWNCSAREAWARWRWHSGESLSISSYAW